MSTTVAYGQTGELPRVTARIVQVPFDQYEVSVLLSESGQILGIEEIRVRKDFRKPSEIKSLDFDEYYKE